jgi:hypothetical protein
VTDSRLLSVLHIALIALLIGALRMAPSRAAAAELDDANTILRQGVLAYGDKYYDAKTRLVARTDGQWNGRLNIAQHSPEYAAALLDAPRKGRDDVARAHAIINAMIDHQWLRGKGTWKYGNFIWWHDQKGPQDANAVAFMSPWLSYYLVRHADKLTDETEARLRKALPLCLEAVRSHRGPVHYDNIWFLKAASLVMIADALDRPELLPDADKRLGQWIAYVSKHGINEFNSPCYAAVNVYALEWIWCYAPKSAKSLRAKARQLLDFFYATIFQNWHWEGGVGAGTHSRAYPRDRLTGASLVSFLVWKQCGGELRGHIRSFEYNFAINNYRVPDRIRAWARKEGKTPLRLRASHPGWGNYDVRVDRSLYLVPEFSLATQTGYRANADQAIPFKITYAGSKVAERASFIRPIPPHDRDSRTRGPLQFAHHQADDRAIVLYEADIKGDRRSAYMRLVIEPREGEDSDGGTKPGGMLDAMLVDGKPYERKRLQPKPGMVIAWRVGTTCVALRLLECWGVNPADPTALVERGYSLLPTKKVGVCLHGLVCYQPKKPVAVDDLSCGFVVRVATVDDVGSLAKLSEAAAAWQIDEKQIGGKRDIHWTDGDATLRLVWNGPTNKATIRSTNGKKLGRFPLYESPLVRFDRGGEPQVVEPQASLDRPPGAR